LARLRIATFNLENLDARLEIDPPLERRIAVLRPQLLRLDADVLCLQEVNAQSGPRHRRALSALDALLAGTPYAGFARAISASASGGKPADRHNLVLLCRPPIAASRQIWHDLVPPQRHAALTTADGAASLELRFDRPILHARLGLAGGRSLHILNLHLKAPIAAPIPGQKRSASVWRSVGGWAEGFQLASLKRAAQALEARLALEEIFAREGDPLIAVCGDFNAESREVPVRMLLGAVEDTGNPALAAQALTALDRLLPAERRYSVLHAGARVMLDHILVSPALLACHRAIEAHNESLADEALGGGERPLQSFHAPLVAEFALPD
jgi:endonuclease/exonuclease/phosphatase family metal-dependent hydrolase